MLSILGVIVLGVGAIWFATGGGSIAGLIAAAGAIMIVLDKS